MSRTVPPDRRSWTVAEWPAADRAAWTAARQPGSVLDPGGEASHWRARTAVTNEQHYGRWIGWLAFTGLLDNAQPAERITRARIAAWQDHLATRVAPRTRLSLLVGLKIMAQALAPEHDWGWLQQVCNRIQRNAPPSRDKRARIVHPLRVVDAALERLAALPVPIQTRGEALFCRDALLLALAALRPLRLRNLAMIELDRHLVGPAGDRHLRFAGDETKNGDPLGLPFPADLEPWIVRYLREARPILLRGRQYPRLWIGATGRPLVQGAFYPLFIKRTKAWLGAPLNPHLLRDCAATLLADAADGSENLAPALLGHRHRATTERYYVHADTVAAGRRVNAVLAALLEESKP